MENQNKLLSELDITFLEKCLKLAEEAVNAGDQPFGSILVNSENKIIAEARNRVNELGPLAHPEFELADWAIKNLSATERKETRMYTTGEHCPMCSTAHGWAGLGSIIYLSSAKQLEEWMKEFKVPPSPINFYPVQEIIKNIKVKGPASGKLLQQIKELHKKYYQTILY